MPFRARPLFRGRTDQERVMHQPDHRALTQRSRTGRAAYPMALALLLAAGSAATAQPQASPVILQWFETPWSSIEYRMPDFFIAGYSMTWLPPPSKASANSVGYDPFDRFDLGRPGAGNGTVYGTEQGFRAMVAAFQRANGQVIVDSIMNHNGARTSNAGFTAAGGWPGFYAPNPPANWGDFHDGTTQSENPNGPNYNLYTGDLVGLQDINQASNFQFIRHPVEPGNPQNIPAGTVRNLPDPNNRRFYPDLDLPPTIVNNPGFRDPRCQGSFSGCPNDPNPPFGNRNLNAEQVTIYPFNTQNPMAGDPVPENATALLTRWTRWMLEEFRVDGFRLDASKHINPWFWDRYWDVAVHQRRRAPDGTMVTPFSFVESVAGNDYIFDFNIRRPNGRSPARLGDSFGNRDALDLNGAGQLRNIQSARGAAGWGDATGAHLDNFDDGFNNGTLGVNHVYSHDNGSNGNGGSKPDLPFPDRAAWPQFAYLLMRPGVTKVYHNSRAFHSFSNAQRGFWPREGSPEALGLGRNLSGTDSTLTNLVQLHNRYGRGEYTPRWQDGDVLIFDRRTPTGGGNYVSNVLVGVNDSYSQGFDERVVNTSFPTGTRLWELTGNADNPVVDPSGQIANLLIVGQATPAVGANQVRIRVPRNASSAGEHNKGFVVYGPATPGGVLTVNGVATVIPPDSEATPSFRRRMNAIDVVQGPTFALSLDTFQADANEPRTDDAAIYRFNQGYFNSDVGTNGTAAGEPVGEFRGYENFLTLNQPLFSTGIGLYQQTIQTSLLPEGYNYLSVIAFRHRSTGTEAGSDPIYNEWRKVIYVDRAAPEVQIVADTIDCITGSGTIQLRNPDGTASRVHAFVDLPKGAPIPPLNNGNEAIVWDRNDWLFPVSGLSPGQHTLTVVTLEQPGGVFVSQWETVLNFTVGVEVPGDLNNDGVVDVLDLYAFSTLAGFECAADLNNDGVVNNADRVLLRELARDGEPAEVGTR